MLATAHRATPAMRRLPPNPSPHCVGHCVSAERDGRWPAIADALAELREAGRYSVRIVDADCGAGALLIHAVWHARSLGFTAIEGRGIDGAPALIGRANAAAARERDPAIGLTFEVADLTQALEEEAELPADILLWSGRPAAFEPERMADALRSAGDRLFVDEHTADLVSARRQ